MTTEPPGTWIPRTSAHSERDAALTSLTVPADCSALFPEKPILPSKLAITRRSRFAVAATPKAPIQARTVACTVVSLILGATETTSSISRQVQGCIAELAGIAYTRALGTHLLCEVWRDSEHIFTSVQHDEPFPMLPDDTTIGLNVVKTLADDYGSHMVDGSFQSWAAVRIT